MPRSRLTLTLALAALLAAAPLATVGVLPGFAATAAQAQDASVSFSVFFDKVSDGGRWVHHAKYNYVWCPEVERTWAPYTHGHWRYLAKRGWYFDSDEPNAWAVYHYGRWFQDTDLGWCWVPGNVWAPAWVSWRKSSDYVGWAPLPPDGDGFVIGAKISTHEASDKDWVFVPSKRFLDPTLTTVVVLAADKPDLYRQSQPAGTVVVQNNIIVNTVIDVNFIEQATQKKVPEVTAETVNDPKAVSGKGSQTGTIAIYDATIAEPKQGAAPKQAEEPAQAAQELNKQAVANKAQDANAKPADQSGATNSPPAPAAGDQTAKPGADNTPATDKTPAAQTPPAGTTKGDANAPAPATEKTPGKTNSKDTCADAEKVDGVCPPKSKGTTESKPATDNGKSNATNTPEATHPKAAAPSATDQGKGAKTTDQTSPAAADKGKPAAKACSDGKLVDGVCEPAAKSDNQGNNGKSGRIAPAAGDSQKGGNAQQDKAAPAADANAQAPAKSREAKPAEGNGKAQAKCGPDEQVVNGVCSPKRAAGAAADKPAQQ